MSDQVVHIHDVEIRTGTQIQGRYEITRHLGAGGFAQVFEAFDTNIERPVAIKFLNLHASTSDADASNNILARFKREAKLAAKIQHPNVVNIFDFGVVGRNQNIPFIVMELLSGYDLEEQIYEKGALAAGRTLPLFVRCLEALGEAHKMGIVHKDLKPSNLFLSNPGERSESLRIVDFGIAHIRDAREGRLTATGEILGTPQYLPPEYIEAQIVSPGYDVYQMGLILVETLTGKPVVDEVHPLRCVKAHSMGELDLPTSLLESALGTVIARALHLDHTARFADAEEFADALAEVDPSSLPQLGPDMPTSRLAEAGTLDSNSRIMSRGTGQMRRPSTEQLEDAGAGSTQQGYAHSQAHQSQAGPSGDIASQPTSQHARLKQGPTDQVAHSTAAAIENAGFGKSGIKALLILGVAVLALGGVAAWLLVAKLGDEADELAASELAALEQAASEQAASEQAALEQAAFEQSTSDEPEPEPEPGHAGAARADGDEEPAEKNEAVAAPEPIEMTLDTAPSGATVYRGSEKLGTSPVSLRFEGSKDAAVSLRLTRRGYLGKEISVSPEAAPSLVVELERKPRAKRRRVKKRRERSKPVKKQRAEMQAAKKEKVEPPEPPKEKEETQRMLIAP